VRVACTCILNYWLFLNTLWTGASNRSHDQQHMSLLTHSTVIRRCRPTIHILATRGVRQVGLLCCLQRRVVFTIDSSAYSRPSCSHTHRSLAVNNSLFALAVNQPATIHSDAVGTNAARANIVVVVVELGRVTCDSTANHALVRWPDPLSVADPRL